MRQDATALALAANAAIAAGRKAGLELLSALAHDTRMADHHRLYSRRAHLLEQAGEPDAARQLFRRAARDTASLAEKRYLESRAARLGSNRTQ